MCADHRFIVVQVVDGLGKVPQDTPALHREQPRSDPFSSISFFEIDQADEYARLLTEDERHLAVRPGHDVVRHLRSLGKGGNGSVEMVRFNGEPMVMKTLLRREDIPGLLKEIRIQRELAGAGGAPEIHGLSLVPARVIMTYTGPTYDRYIETCTLEQVIRTLIIVAQKLNEIHEKGFAHNDLKLNNITVGVSKDDIHIIDFGLSTRLGQVLWPSGKTSARRPWYAPELYEGKPSTRASDVYSFGEVIAQVLKEVLDPNISYALSVLQVYAKQECPADRLSLHDLIRGLSGIAKVAEAL